MALNRIRTILLADRIDLNKQPFGSLPASGDLCDPERFKPATEFAVRDRMGLWVGTRHRLGGKNFEFLNGVGRAIIGAVL